MSGKPSPSGNWICSPDRKVANPGVRIPWYARTFLLIALLRETRSDSGGEPGVAVALGLEHPGDEVFEGRVVVEGLGAVEDQVGAGSRPAPRSDSSGRRGRRAGRRRVRARGGRRRPGTPSRARRGARRRPPWPSGARARGDATPRREYRRRRRCAWSDKICGPSRCGAPATGHSPGPGGRLSFF